MYRLKSSICVFAALLGVFCMGIASADNGAKNKSKAYEITIASATKVGTVVLTPGDYKLKMDGETATFKKDGTGKIFTAVAKLEAGKEDFDQTMIYQVQDGGQNRIIAIELKGTQTLLKFN